LKSCGWSLVFSGGFALIATLLSVREFRCCDQICSWGRF
jgi:hypothetical protein